ncbi:MAG: glutamine amidotransferase [Acidobacteriia bacterium]|nr:glutamine amidotransferase [Terriglobia bacterium]
MLHGYNRIAPNKSGKVVATVRRTGDLAIVVRTFGEGRAVAFVLDIAPQWGTGFRNRTH